MREWMEIDLDLPERPQFRRIMLLTGESREVVLGRLFRLWRWAARHTDDGAFPGMTAEALAELLGGDVDFWLSLADKHVGWLEFHDDGVVVPGWKKRFGAAAKKRRSDQCRRSVDNLSTQSADGVWPPPRSRRTGATTDGENTNKEAD